MDIEQRHAPIAPMSTARRHTGFARGTDQMVSGRHLEKLLLCLRQSWRGLQVAAKSIDDSSGRGARWIAEMSGRRHAKWSELDRLTRRRRATGLRRRLDIAGTFHRPWIRFISRAGTAGVLDECDRGESSLLKAADRALKDDPPQELHNRLADLRQDVDAAVEAIRSERRRLDEGSLAPRDPESAQPQQREASHGR
jgi:hypothetical protein